MKNEFEATFNNVIVKELPNPLEEKKLDSGIILPSYLEKKNDNTGEMEEEQDIYMYGEIQSVGPESAFKKGGKIFYHFRAFTSLPFFRQLDRAEIGIINERDIIVYKDGE